jgi:effector-binding domain-containing protein
MITNMKTMTQENPVLEESDVCCPVFDPALWNNKRHEWSNKLFLKDSVPEIFHIPLPSMYGKVITRMWEKANDTGAVPALKDFLLLAHDPSPFKSELFMAITKEIPGEENVRLSGTYMTRVFDGPYNHVPKYIKEMDGYLASLKLKAKKYYFYYAYCPKCSKKYGHNYIVAFAEV